MLLSNEFQVSNKTVVITGGSRGLGLAVGRQLAERGANVVIVARDQQRLVEGLKHIQQGALHPETQRFHQISANLSLPTEAARVIDEVGVWNAGPPDIVWCCAGTSHPTLFIDTPPSQLEAQMSSNYFTTAYMAHATLNSWLRPSRAKTTSSPTSGNDKPSGAHSSQTVPRHLIFTSSVAAFFSLAGYGPYNPAKAALRALSDTLSQEMHLYAAAHPNEPPVRLHTIFPGTILGEAYDEENKIKTDVTKMLEGEEGLTSEVIARKSIRALEGGEELITTDFTGHLLKRTMLGGTRRGFWRVLGDTMLASILSVVVAFVRADMDRKVRQFGRKFGTSGMKAEHH
ncbi:hypothetical protein EV127DRAFT_444209 [Xylaria flabelliformis]|nr:hypothetical protein EV127DRAFT_444209 [Xylaria flabelliformis]